MKKLISLISIAVFIIACNNGETKTGTTVADSTAATDSAAHNVMDTTKNMMNKANVVLDSAAKKMDNAAEKVKDTSAKK